MQCARRTRRRSGWGSCKIGTTANWLGDSCAIRKIRAVDQSVGRIPPEADAVTDFKDGLFYPPVIHECAVYRPIFDLDSTLLSQTQAGMLTRNLRILKNNLIL
jgi:hypothetical protein